MYIFWVELGGLRNVCTKNKLSDESKSAVDNSQSVYLR